MTKYVAALYALCDACGVEVPTNVRNDQNLTIRLAYARTVIVQSVIATS